MRSAAAAGIPAAASATRIAAVVSAAAASLTIASAPAAPDAVRNGRIVFQQIDAGLGNTLLFTVDVNGRNLRVLTRQNGVEGNGSQPDWSPDGRRIAFRRFAGVGRPDERAHVYVVSVGGGGLRNLTRVSCTGLCVENEEPAWSPDGKRIAFVRTLAATTRAGQPRVGIFVMNADGTGVRQLTQRRGTFHTEDHAPTWSPDGKRLAFMSINITFKPPGASQIYVIKADGTRPRVVRALAHDWPGAGAPAWSPDGTRLLYSTYCWFGNCGQRASGAQLFTVGVDGKNLRQLTRLSGNSFGARWSPDGKRIVFVRNGRVGPDGALYTMNADGSGVRRVTGPPARGARSPDWGRAPS